MLNRYIGRYHRVRLFAPDYLSAPYILDRQSDTLMPYRHQDWEYLADMGLLPAVRGGAFTAMQFPSLQWPPDFLSAAISQLTVALSNAYTHGSAGNCLAQRVTTLSTPTLTGIYFFVTAVGGTGAAQVDVQFRNDNAGAPGSTIHASGSTGALSATGWASVTGLSFVTSANTIYYACVNDANGDPTNNVTVLRTANTTGVFDAAIQGWNRTSLNSTNGYSSNTILSTSSVIAVFDAYSQGNPFTAGNTFASSTNRRGWRIGGVTEDIAIWGMSWGGALTSGNGIELYADDGTAPGGTTLASGSLAVNTSAASPTGHRFSAAQTLSGATTYRLVSTFSGASTAARFFEIGTGAAAALAAAMPGGGSWYLALANGTTNWSNDNVYAIPGARLLMADQLEIASSGGPGPRIHQVASRVLPLY